MPYVVAKHPVALVQRVSLDASALRVLQLNPHVAAGGCIDIELQASARENERLRDQLAASVGRLGADEAVQALLGPNDLASRVVSAFEPMRLVVGGRVLVDRAVPNDQAERRIEHPGSWSVGIDTDIGSTVRSFPGDPVAADGQLNLHQAVVPARLRVEDFGLGEVPVDREGRDVDVIGPRVLHDRGRVDVHVRRVLLVEREHRGKLAGESRATNINRRIGELPPIPRREVIGFPARDRTPPGPVAAQRLPVVPGRDPVAEVRHVTSDPLIPEDLVLRVTVQRDAVSAFPGEPKAVGRHGIAESEWTEVRIPVEPIPLVALLRRSRGVLQDAPRHPWKEVV